MKTGGTWNKLTWVAEAAPIVTASGSRSASMWRCACGDVVRLRDNSVKRGNTKTCGCGLMNCGVTHGHKNHPLYNIWRAMIRRCHVPNSAGWQRYGGRGIYVCAAWHSFQTYATDMGPRPSLDHQMDRVDNSGPYAPGNVRWATRTQNQGNTRRNRNLTAWGRTQCISAWAREVGMALPTLDARLRRGLAPEQALTFPLHRGRRISAVQDHG